MTQHLIFNAPWSARLIELGQQAAQYRTGGKIYNMPKYQAAIQAIDTYTAAIKAAFPSYFYSPEEEARMAKEAGARLDDYKNTTGKYKRQE